jgi:hypothetical protein
VRVLQGGLVLRHGRGLAAGVGGGEEQRLDQLEVAFGLHAVHQDRADHAAPADETDQRLSCVRHFQFALVKKESRLFWRPARRSREGHDESGCG